MLTKHSAKKNWNILSKYKYLNERTLLHTRTVYPTHSTTTLLPRSSSFIVLFSFGFRILFFVVCKKENLLNLFNTDFNVIGFLRIKRLKKNTRFSVEPTLFGAKDGKWTHSAWVAWIQLCGNGRRRGDWCARNKCWIRWQRKFPLLYIHIYLLFVTKQNPLLYCLLYSYPRTFLSYYSILAFIFEYTIHFIYTSMYV